MLEPYRAMPVKNTDTATWLEASIEKPWGRGDNANYAAAIIPRGFKSYARLLHPGYIGNGEREVSWSEVAEHFMRKPHAQMQWHAITKSHHSGISSVGFKAPNTGSLPQNQAKVLVEILRKHTTTPQDCYFAIWDGWGFFVSDELQSEAAYLKLPHRGYYLVRGTIEIAAQSISSLSWQSASIWWPRDRAWCVATEVDLMWTYIGGKSMCIDEILRDKRLDTWSATLDDRVDIQGDLINI
ncbi:hypothetical protein HNQ56_001207 [Anaerotaenia torta]|uniref:hypothetical protein n=1 Tax=Anaerotaenia torta TaxID=433293 RepID=UPI003D1B4335